MKITMKRVGKVSELVVDTTISLWASIKLRIAGKAFADTINTTFKDVSGLLWDLVEDPAKGVEVSAEFPVSDKKTKFPGGILQCAEEPSQDRPKGHMVIDVGQMREFSDCVSPVEKAKIDLAFLARLAYERNYLAKYDSMGLMPPRLPRKGDTMKDYAAMYGTTVADMRKVLPEVEAFLAKEGK